MIDTKEYKESILERDRLQEIIDKYESQNFELLEDFLKYADISVRTYNALKSAVSQGEMKYVIDANFKGFMRVRWLGIGCWLEWEDQLVKHNFISEYERVKY